MKFDFAPMEGITDFSWRLSHSRHFPGTDRYFSPFVAANRTFSFKTREKKDVAPENNSGVIYVPQILTNQADVFLWAAGEMQKRGWDTVNLNLGCPSATVVTHGKGAGFLADTDRLDAFFEEVFEGLPGGISVSVKTRIGLNDSSEAEGLLAVYNRYPISELIVHPRLRKDFYKGEPDLEAFELFCEGSVHPLIYNGDVASRSSYETIVHRFPGISGMMIGRGLIADPALVRELRGGPFLTNSELAAFHDEVLDRRMADLGGFRNTVGKMKELWYYMGPMFLGADRLLKKVKKADDEAAYRKAAEAVFTNCELKHDHLKAT